MLFYRPCFLVGVILCCLNVVGYSSKPWRWHEDDHQVPGAPVQKLAVVGNVQARRFELVMAALLTLARWMEALKSRCVRLWGEPHGAVSQTVSMWPKDTNFPKLESWKTSAERETITVTRSNSCPTHIDHLLNGHRSRKHTSCQPNQQVWSIWMIDGKLHRDLENLSWMRKSTLMGAIILKATD